MEIVTMLFVALVASGCAIGNRYAYSTVVVNPNVSGTATVSVAAHDERNYVRTGDKSPQFLGLQRGGFGNPFDVCQPLHIALLVPAVRPFAASRRLHV